MSVITNLTVYSGRAIFVGAARYLAEMALDLDIPGAAFKDTLDDMVLLTEPALLDSADIKEAVATKLRDTTERMEIDKSMAHFQFTREETMKPLVGFLGRLPAYFHALAEAGSDPPGGEKVSVLA